MTAQHIDALESFDVNGSKRFSMRSVQSSKRSRSSGGIDRTH